MTRAALPPLTAILTCRNAAGTLSRLLDHLQRAGATVIMFDHGSTDGTYQIAASRRGAPVADLIRMPYDGTFDLTEQLNLKAQVIGTIGAGWVLHADADEFLDAPSGATLRAFAARWDAGACIAIPCKEFLFLPASETESHSAADFEDTLTTYVPLAERDPKQRLFRHDAPLDLWRATGGHTITRDPARIAPEPVSLRHYLGLSLDDIRAQYYGRVFAPRDLARHWHGHRRTSPDCRIAAPPSGVLRDRRVGGLDATDPATLLPVFSEAPRSAIAGSGTPADLLVVASDSDPSHSVVDAIEGAFPGLRLRVLDDPAVFPPGRVPAPVLHLVEHPVSFAAGTEDPEARRDLAVAWVRRVASARQMALRLGVVYRELRVEDALPELALVALVRGLILGSGTRGAEGFLTPVPVPEPEQSSDPVVAVAGPLGRDLGYRIGRAGDSESGAIAAGPASRPSAAS